MAPRKHKTELDVADKERFGTIFAQMEEVGLGKPAASTSAQVEASATVATPAPMIEADSYKGMTRVEKLFKAIDLGDAATIRDTIKAKYVPNKDGTESAALIESALSLVPGNKREAHHFPEPLLQRAARSEQMASVQELITLGNELPAVERKRFFNATRELDGANVLHDLAASVPADNNVNFSAKADGKWHPEAVIAKLLETDIDILAKKDEKTAADLAPNAKVKAFLQAEIDKILAEDQQHDMKWQAKLARKEREKAPDGGYLRST